MAVIFPKIGRWYRRPNRALFEVVAIDEEDGTLEIQYFDGTVAELELDGWPDLVIEQMPAPEDWSGALDVAPEDTVHDQDGQLPHDWSDPLEVMERERNNEMELTSD